MEKKNLVLTAVTNSLMVFVYVSLIGWLMFNGERFLGHVDDNFWMPVAMLLLFVSSAAIVGSIVLLKPILMYMEGQKAEAIKLLMFTLVSLAVITIVAFTLIAIV